MRHQPILVLEDEILIAIDIEASLASGGYSNIKLFHSCADANGWLTNNTPSVAILDLHLGNGSCVAVAQTLSERSVPFIICSGIDQHDESVEDVLRKGHWLGKPTEPRMLLATVEAHLTAAAPVN
jgi:DNA-binding response OmpR family regulator